MILMNEILRVLLQNTLIVAALIPLVWCIGRWRRCRPAEQNLLWLALMMKLVLPPFWTLEVSVPAALQPNASFPIALQGPAVQGRSDPRDYAQSRLDDSQTAERDFQWSSGFFAAFGTYIAWIWLGGAVFSSWVMGRRIVRELDLIRHGKPAPAELVQCVDDAARGMQLRHVSVRMVEALASPVVLWWWRPVLLWPASIMEEPDRRRIASLVMHELAHLRRGDHLVAWLEMIVAVVHWWNPVFWLVRRQLRETRESACDATALQISGQSPQEYIEMLMEMTTGRSFKLSPAPIVGVGAVSQSSLKRRIQMVFEKKLTGRVSVMGLMVAGCLGTLLLVGIGESRAQSSQVQGGKEQITEVIEELIAEAEKNNDSTSANELRRRVPDGGTVLLGGIKVKGRSESESRDPTSPRASSVPDDGLTRSSWPKSRLKRKH